MNKVSIVIPVIRPKQVKQTIKAIKANAGVPASNYEIITMEDNKRIGAPKMVKKLVDMTNYDLVMFLGDDTLPKKNFLKNSIKAMESFQNLDGLVGLNDLNKKSWNAPTHWLASKKLLPKLGGEFFHTGYIHQFCDNELYFRCKDIGKYVFAANAQLEHKHPGYKEKELTFNENIDKHGDPDYKRVYSLEVYKHDEELFIKRMKQLKLICATGERVVPGDMKGDVKTFQEHLSRYNFALGFCTNKTVLDAACGTGYGVNLLAESATLVDGWDISEEAINFAKRKYQGNFEVHDLTKKLPDKKYNVITSFETIEHMENPNNFLKWVVGHCDTFIFSVPLNNSSKYHAKVYNLGALESIMLKYWSDIKWSNQEWINIAPGIMPRSAFAIGICEKDNKLRHS